MANKLLSSMDAELEAIRILEHKLGDTSISRDGKNLLHRIIYRLRVAMASRYQFEQ